MYNVGLYPGTLYFHLGKLNLPKEGGIGKKAEREQNSNAVIGAINVH